MGNHEKFVDAIYTLESNADFIYDGLIKNENDFNNINWVIDKDENDNAITTNTCPYASVTWAKIKAEMNKL